MIRSMIRPMISSMIKSMVNPLSGFITRYFSSLNPIVTAHYEILEPITFTGDFEVSFDVLSSTLGTMGVVGKTVDAATFFGLNSSGMAEARFGDNAAVAGTTVIADGKLHTVKFKRAGSLRTITVDGVVEYSATSTIVDVNVEQIGVDGFNRYLDGIVANVKFTDNSGAQPVTQTFPLNFKPSSALYEYGAELWVNPPNSIGSGWVVDGLGVYTHTGASSEMQITNNTQLKASTNYNASIKVVGTGFVTIQLGGAPVDGVNRSAALYAGTHEIQLNTNSVLVFDAIRIIGTDDSTISNVSIREITNYAQVEASKNIEYSDENTFGGDISSDTWNLNANWTFIGGQLIADGTNSSDANQGATIPVIDEIYQLTYTVDEITQGDANVSFGGVVISTDALGEFSLPIRAISTDRLRVIAANNFIGKISNVQVKEIQGNAITAIRVADELKEKYTLVADDWVGEELWDYSIFTVSGSATKVGDTAIFNVLASEDARCSQATALDIGQLYRYEVEISNYVVGDLAEASSGFVGLGINGDGVYTSDFIPTTTEMLFRRNGAVCDYTVKVNTVKRILQKG